jgi:aryl-alcohol dehydrogenase-like predicted oxidoreductase
MDYIHLGRTGLLVSPLCLGTMNFGQQTREDDSHRVMDRALEHGINFFDTANRYGGTAGEGPLNALSATGLRRGTAGARRWSWPPSCTAAWATGRIPASCRR